MTGGCSNACTKAEDVVDSENVVDGRTRERIASSNITRNILSGHVNVDLRKGCCSKTTDGIQTRPRSVLSKVIPTRKASLKISPSRPVGNLIHEQAKADVKLIGTHRSKNFQSSVTISEPGIASTNLRSVPKNNVVETPSIRSVAKSPSKEKSSGHRQTQKILAKSLPVNTPTATKSERIGSENHHDKPPKAQQRTAATSNDSSASQRKTGQVDRNGAGSTRNQKTKVPSQVGGEKIKSTPLASQSKFPLRRVKISKNEENRGKQLSDDSMAIAQELLRLKHLRPESLVKNIALSHISEDSNGINEKLGISCPLCENDLMSFPPNFEYHDGVESSNLPEVAVLYCGHSFHSSCLEDIIPPEDQCRDPPCYFCLSNTD